MTAIRALVLPVLCLLAPWPAAAQTFVFHLRGDQEVPPVPSTAAGGCLGILDQGLGQLALTCVHSVAGATLMHVHEGAAGTNGPAVFDLGDPASPVTATWTGMMPGDVANVLSGDLYVNIHTAGRPSGEIRGQLLPRTVDTVDFTANGAQVVPPDPTTATGDCSADLSDDATELAVGCSHNLPGTDAAHLHAAPFGQNGPEVYAFDSSDSPLAADVAMTPQMVAELAAGFLYLDVHDTGTSEEDPGATIRGQIGTPPAVVSTGTIEIAETTIPPSATSFAFTHDVPGGGGAFNLSHGQTRTFLGVPAGTYTFSESDPGALGHALVDVHCGDADSSGDPFARTATVSLQAGETVVCTFTNLESGGADHLFVFDLAGAQEAPPVTSPARGGCFGQLRTAAAEMSLFCVHDVAGPTLMHLHRGALGVNGPVAFDLGSPVSPVQAVWTGMTPSDVADLLAGNLYVNVHTAGRPSGEIRGQLLERTLDAFAFPLDAGQTVPPGTSASQGTCAVDLDSAATVLSVSCAHGVSSPTAAHLHEGPAGSNGPLAFSFATPTSPFAGNVPLSPRLVADFAAGFLYVDVHRQGDEGTGDEIRGQVVRGVAGGVTDVPALGTWGGLALGLALLALGLRRLAR